MAAGFAVFERRDLRLAELPAERTARVPPGRTSRVVADDGQLFVFPTALGWMALVEAEGTATSGGMVLQLTLAHKSPQAAIRALEPPWRYSAAADGSCPLAVRLQAYAEGAVDDFLDVPLEDGRLTGFQRRIREFCRRIPLGQTRTYGELAEAAGFPRAARAVGTVMSSNRIPILVPCHRVLRAGGLGGYSAGAGVPLKVRLLDMERAAAAPHSPRVASSPPAELCRA